MRQQTTTFILLVLGWISLCGAATEIFVDCSRPDDSGDGLTRETAKRTIQAAVDATATGTAASPNFITVFPGDYDEGGALVDADNVLSRVSFKGKKYITLQAADPANKPRIVGRHDPDTANGIGPNAVRCVYGNGGSENGIVLKNLILCNGATHSTQTNSNHASYGGAVCYWATLVDCIVSNCAGSVGAVYDAAAYRTLFVGNYRALRNTKAFSCVFRDGSGYVLDYSGALVNCTVVGHGSYVVGSSSPMSSMINCLIFDNVSARGTLFANGYPTNCVTDVTVDSKYAFANGAANANCANPAFGGTHPDGIVPIARETKVVGAANVALYDKLVKTSPYADLDFYGNPRKTDGRMNVGAVEATVAGPYKTIHVDPNGNDAQSGFGPDRPMRTLLEACRAAVAMGTNGWTVLAGPGTYAEGSDYTGASATLRARCFVSNNVSLVSRDGKDVTTIVGASVDRNENGDGVAIRGAYMNYHKDGDLRLPATIRGFTFADCIIPNNSTDKYRGGAIYANDAFYCYVEDCFFTNCSSYSAAVQAASVRRCAAVDCDSLANASVQHNCSFDLSKNSRSRQAKAFYNCTFVGTGKVVVDQAYEPFYNCAFSGGCYVAGTVSNCLFSSNTALGKALTNIGSRVIADLKLNVDGTPMKGSPLIDAALAKHSTLAVDANGGNRIYNGLPDIGAFEYDWRPDYAAYLLKNGRFDVTNATKTVTLDTANLPLGIKLGSGGTLAGVWTAQTASSRSGGDIAYRVTGNGSLKVYRDGALVETLKTTEGDGWATLRLTSTDPAMHLAFTYTAGSSDPGTAYLGAFRDTQPFILLVR